MGFLKLVFRKWRMNYKVFFLILIIFSFLPLNIHSEKNTNLFPENPLEGSKIFVIKGCVKCHAIKGEGGNIGADLGKVTFKDTLLDMAGIMWNHFPFMSEKMEEEKIDWPKFLSGEMASLIGYLYYINYFDEPGNTKKGENLFSVKGCAQCHGIEKKGGKPGPSLSKFKRDYSPIFMAQAMWNHGSEMEASMKKLGIKRPQFNDKEMADLSAYIRKEARGEKKGYGFMLPGNPKEGKQLFNKKGCIHCHAISNEGGNIGPDLGKKAEELHRSLNEVAGIMWNHWPNMYRKMIEMRIEVPSFSDKEMADIIAYLYFLGYFDEKGDMKKGSIIFNEKGCIKCHFFDGKQMIGPDLRKLSNTTSSIEVVTEMWNHASKMKNKMAELKIQWPKFKKGEVADLMQYLRSLKK
ncbi:MAG: hypothetical protein A3C43_04835 [Candidatus Schekmanbacteria bacterium RIFCSPHIGHO2_02_FULL_38_11]|uniref:Cytochrome c domain-containing protein n=1 Tax=Candidatus Schekmanbacteria bacterium RIFCSPLOWO2_12_FULL_38_15 TaxID=1817883 RepID=A0A1F7SNT2_9BACT|nr:MAG: hypothetical protein A2043_05270 [Candidatus Schekmanbacteria bacterium GWA2_38_9]OGL48507.1 MAG: hypothetical protein A3C43_04835 [Candidatus Schekmanbacteria bacterium RIFCSPHIGHO2_02_FULL_38_11]OGL50244.1 MAG: hypothetical protein A3H37_00630 [Candidatus Schekmanbacteria bacterium RIFCSPLOWO2_02_FULL_38_14]OGL55445.1 MAG: hypothetical protein A3G31_01370 [Candidatus Schekmanbacteria bacterium RIFCSPLOWO2_12_FULL_38_15]